MTVSESQSGHDPRHEEVLTLAEAAAYFRVPEQALLDLAVEQAIPGQRIGGEWRFLKRALSDWLRYGPRFFRHLGMLSPPWLLDYPPPDELLMLLERRILDRLAAGDTSTIKPGSKQKVLEHFGIFSEVDDLDEQLTAVRKRREAGG